MTRFDFENAPTWETSTGDFLPVGNHVVNVLSAEGSRTKNDNPQIELELGNDSGTRKDWLVYAEEKGVSKVATLFRLAGIPLSNADQNEDGSLKDETIAKLVGKSVGIVVREEQKYNGAPGEMQPRIKGYVDPAVISQNGSTAAKAQPVGAASPVGDDDIPF